jgi:hypothetical protein
MKYTRLEMQSRFSGTGIRSVVVFFIFLPLLAIIIGNFITRLFIIPYVSKNIQAPQYAGSSIVVKADEQYRFFILQAGVFSLKENAQLLTKGIVDGGMKAYTIADKENFKIIIDVSPEKSRIDSDMEKMKGMGYNCVIKEIVVNPTIFKNISDSEKIKDYAMSSASIFNSMFDILNESKDKNSDGIREKIENLKKDFPDVSQISQDSSLKTELELFNKSFIKTSESFINNFADSNLDGCTQNLYEAAVEFEDLYSSILKIRVQN